MCGLLVGHKVVYHMSLLACFMHYDMLHYMLFWGVHTPPGDNEDRYELTSIYNRSVFRVGNFPKNEKLFKPIGSGV
jgi:hypothetical protein